MPQLERGGKFTYGWSKVGDAGRIVVPKQALEEYHLLESQKVILMPGSRTSGGFALGCYELVERSPFGRRVVTDPTFGQHDISEGEVILIGGKPYCWIRLRAGRIRLGPDALSSYGVILGDRLLVIRGSSLAIAFATRGPIVQDAARHTELDVFVP
jgi:hypothetical protein